MRYTPETLLSYLTDPIDRVLLLQNPILPMPHRGHLPRLEPGERRYVIARDGLYVQARTLALEVCVALANTPALPFGPLESKLTLAGGLLPRQCFKRMCSEAAAQSPQEWAALVHWDIAHQCYEFRTVPSLHHSEAHFAYDSASREESRLVLDVHSHGSGPAFFSATDDASDRYGVYFATVLGRCDAPERIEVRTRLVMDGLRIPLQWHPWKAGRSDIADPAERAMLTDDPSTEHR